MYIENNILSSPFYFDKKSYSTQNMEHKFSNELKKAIAYSKEEAIRLGNTYIGNEHLFLGVLREGSSLIVQILKHRGANLPAVRTSIEVKIKSHEVLQVKNEIEIPFIKASERTLQIMHYEAFKAGETETTPDHLILALLQTEKRSGSGIVSDILSSHEISYATFKSFLSINSSRHTDDDDEDENEEEYDDFLQSKSEKSSGRQGEDSSKKNLDNYGKDLTQAALENKLDPIVGREKEIERLVQILNRRKKNNPVLIGEPGVGKTAIVEGLANAIAQKKAPNTLLNKQIFSLDLSSIVAGTKYRGQFEERMKKIMQELKNNPDTILFIDEIHTLIGAGGAIGSLDASNILKPALSRGEIQVIGATTPDEYRQHLEKDGALERRFQKIMVEPTTPEETEKILENIKERYETHHKVKYSEEALEYCIKLTDRYIGERYFPDKAIDAMDEAGSRVHISNVSVPESIKELEEELKDLKEKKVVQIKKQNYEAAASIRDVEIKVTQELIAERENWENFISEHRHPVERTDIEEVVSLMSGIPLTGIAQDESLRLLEMKTKLQEKVIGQDPAIETIVKAIQRNRTGLKDPHKPIGTFIFLGSTGVGKTHLAKKLSEFMFDTEDALIRIDMSEYMEKFSVSRLIGAPPGYVGYGEGGMLTEKVRQKPYSVILLDEIEKAHPDVFHLLLQVFDDGQLTDSIGRKVDFKNTVIIMTSNIGARKLEDFGKGIGFASTQDEDVHSNSVINKALKKTFSPEFLNRIDESVVFKSLKKEDIFKIIDIELLSLRKRIKDLGFNLTISEEAKQFIAEKGLDTKYGARPLKRAIQNHIENAMAESIIKSEITSGDEVLIDLNKENQSIAITPIRQKQAIASNENDKK